MAQPRGAYVPPPPTDPQVTILDGKYIQVSPEPLTFKVGAGSVKITWSLPEDGPYTFPDNGITFLPPNDVKVTCPPNQGGRKQFVCINPRRDAGQAKYVIRVNGPNGSLRPLDPALMNEP